MEFLYGAPQFPHEKGEFCTRASYDYYSFYCFSTPFLYEKDGVLTEGKAGEIIVNGPGEVVYHGPISPQESFTNDWMHIGGDDLKELIKKYPIPTATRLRHNNPMLLKNVAKKIRRELALKSAGYEDKIDCILREMVIEIHRCALKTRNADTPKGSIEAAREEIMQHPERYWSLENMAALSGYSISRFSALYNEIYGLSPKSDLLNCRMELAESMLRYSSLSVSAVGSSCGFDNIYYFSKYFKQRHGVSPSEFAANAKN